MLLNITLAAHHYRISASNWLLSEYEVVA